MKMKRYFLGFLFALFFLLSCGPTQQIPNTYGTINTENIGKQAIKTTVHTLDRPGFNKTCKKEKISSNLDRWSQVSFKSYEDGRGFIEYYYIAEDKNPSTIYKLDLDIDKKDTTFVVEIRRTVNIK